jgi:hypothetical protein
MIHELFENTRETWDHVLDGRSTIGEKAACGAEAIALSLAAFALGKFTLARCLSKAEASLPELTITVGREAAVDPEKEVSELKLSKQRRVEALGSPYAALSQQLAAELHPVLSRWHYNLESFLLSLETTVNNFNRVHFPKLPELSFKASNLMCGEADYEAGRVQIKSPDEFPYHGFVVYDLIQGIGTEGAESTLADSIAHEVAHHEHAVARISRIADKSGIGKSATEEEIYHIYKQLWGNSSSNVIDIAEYEKEFIAKIIHARDGETLDETQSLRADSLIRSGQEQVQVHYRTDVVDRQLQDLYNGYRPGVDLISSSDDAASYYRSIMDLRSEELNSGNKVLPDALRAPIERSLRMQLAYPDLTDAELGAQLYRQHFSLLNGLRSHSKLAYELYRSLFHEKEAFAVGAFVERDYKVLQKTLADSLNWHP